MPQENTSFKALQHTFNAQYKVTGDIKKSICSMEQMKGTKLRLGG